MLPKSYVFVLFWQKHFANFNFQIVSWSRQKYYWCTDTGCLFQPVPFLTCVESNTEVFHLKKISRFFCRIIYRSILRNALSQSIHLSLLPPRNCSAANPDRFFWNQLFVLTITVCVTFSKIRSADLPPNYALKDVLDEAVWPQKPELCQKHWRHEIQLYCCTDQQKICFQCLGESHIGHEIELVGEWRKNRLTSFWNRVNCEVSRFQSNDIFRNRQRERLNLKISKLCACKLLICFQKSSPRRHFKHLVFSKNKDVNSIFTKKNNEHAKIFAVVFASHALNAMVGTVCDF